VFISELLKTTRPFAANFGCIDGRELVVGAVPMILASEVEQIKPLGQRTSYLVKLYENLFERVWENASIV